MATLTPERVTFTTRFDVAAHPEAMEELVDGLRNTLMKIDDPEFDALYAASDPNELEHPSISAYDEHVMEPAAREIAPGVARMLTEAVNRRLPWTWEPER